MIYDALVAGCVGYTLFRIVCGLIEAHEALRRAPWPQPRTTPEPRRLTIVRNPRVYDWARDDADRAFPRALRG